jgi:hypothetical protein
VTPRLVTAVAILSQRPSPWLHQRSFFLHPGAGAGEPLLFWLLLPSSRLSGSVSSVPNHYSRWEYYQIPKCGGWSLEQCEHHSRKGNTHRSTVLSHEPYTPRPKFWNGRSESEKERQYSLHLHLAGSAEHRQPCDDGRCGVASGLPAAPGWAIIPAARAVLVVAAAQK